VAETPTRLLAALRRTAAALRGLHRPFALVGGLAVSVRAEPRFTRDIDLAVAVANDVEAEALVADLQASGFALHLSLEQRALHRLATARLIPPGEPAEGIVVDLLFASSGIEPEICAAAEEIAIAEDLVIPVAMTGHLLAMKLLARAGNRPQDAIDLDALIPVLTATERARARAAVDRIERLGANRGKPLRIELETLLARTA
jgi:predicted nucleotidyltransferase